MPLFPVLMLGLVLVASILVWTVDAVLRARRGSRPVQSYRDMFRQLIVVPALMVLLAADLAGTAMVWLQWSALAIAAYALGLAVLRPILRSTLRRRREDSLHTFDTSFEPQRLAS